MSQPIGVPPKFVTSLLRIEGAAVLIATLIVYWHIGANWWFYLLVLAPDLSFVAMAFGSERGAMVYDLVHSYTLPIVLMLCGAFTSVTWLLPAGLIWASHIGGDAALGYGLKYPESVEATHLGFIGKTRKRMQGAKV